MGVAFKLAWGICQRLGDGKRASPVMREFLIGAMGLAAIGTIADVVPLRGENRLLVKFGLKSLRERALPGLKSLLKVAQLEESSSIEADDIAFAIAPRINAAGRLGQARLAVELLTTDKPDRAAMLASHLDELNKSRRAVELKIFKEARELITGRSDWHEAPAVVLAADTWHPGVIGIVASRVVEHFSRPTILIAFNGQAATGQGSGRSHGRFDLHAALSACSMHLISFGGHQAAAGLKISKDRIDAFRDDFFRYVSDNYSTGPRDAELEIDAEVRLADVTPRAVKELDLLSPFGEDNPRPFLRRRASSWRNPRARWEKASGTCRCACDSTTRRSARSPSRGPTGPSRSHNSVARSRSLTLPASTGLAATSGSSCNSSTGSPTRLHRPPSRPNHWSRSRFEQHTGARAGTAGNARAAGNHRSARARRHRRDAPRLVRA